MTARIHWVATLTLLLASGTPARAADGVVKLGVLGSLTGPHAGWDLPATEGIRMAVQQINRAGGFAVGGKKYTFSVVEEDAQSKPEMAASGAQKLLSDDDVRIVLGVLTSTPGMAAANLFARAKVLYIGGFTSLDGLVGKPGNELLFRALNPDASSALVFVPTVIKEQDVKKIGMLLPNDDVAKSIVKTYQPLYEKAGVKVELVEYFQPGTTDFAPVLRKFQRLGLDGLFIGYADPDAEAIVRQSLEIGSLPKRFIYRGGSGAPGRKYGDKIESFSWQILTRDVETTSDKRVLGWLDQYKAFTKKDVTATTYWGLTFYDTIHMLARAMEAAGTVSDPKAIAARLKGMRYEGVRGMSYDAEGHARTDIDVGVLKVGKVYSIPVKMQ